MKKDGQVVEVKPNLQPFENCEAISLIDDTNASNLLNSTNALNYIRRMSLLSKHLLQTPARHQATFLLTKAILFREGCTQGYPLDMLMFMIAMNPPI